MSSSRSSARFTPGRFVMASTDAYGARDGAGLLSQLKYMRTGMESLGHQPALVVLVVDEPELEGAVELVKQALQPVDSGDKSAPASTGIDPGHGKQEGGS